MDESDQKRKEAFEEITKIEANTHSERTAKSALGIHFLQQIGKFAKEGTLHKIKAADEEVNRKDGLREIESEKNFYHSKIKNLQIRKSENKVKIELNYSKQEETRLINFEVSYMVVAMNKKCDVMNEMVLKMNEYVDKLKAAFDTF